MHAMSNLVNRLFFGSIEGAIVVHSLLFEEEADLVTRVQEVVITDMVLSFLISSSEFGLIKAVIPEG